VIASTVANKPMAPKVYIPRNIVSCVKGSMRILSG
jgi:hypothetical protein